MKNLLLILFVALFLFNPLGVNAESDYDGVIRNGSIVIDGYDFTDWQTLITTNCPSEAAQINTAVASGSYAIINIDDTYFRFIGNTTTLPSKFHNTFPELEVDGTSNLRVDILVNKGNLVFQCVNAPEKAHIIASRNIGVYPIAIHFPIQYPNDYSGVRFINQPPVPPSLTLDSNINSLTVNQLIAIMIFSLASITLVIAIVYLINKLALSYGK